MRRKQGAGGSLSLTAPRMSRFCPRVSALGHHPDHTQDLLPDCGPLTAVSLGGVIVNLQEGVPIWPRNATESSSGSPGSPESWRENRIASGQPGSRPTTKTTTRRPATLTPRNGTSNTLVNCAGCGSSAGNSASASSSKAENPIRLTLPSGVVIAGKPDLITLPSGVVVADKPDLITPPDGPPAALRLWRPTIYDVKTGRARCSDRIQVMLYMHLAPQALPAYAGTRPAGCVVCNGSKVDILLQAD